MMKYMLNLLVLLFLSASLFAQSSITQQYNDGDIPTSLGSFDHNCNGPFTYLAITLPPGESIEVTSIDIGYFMQSLGGSNPTLQRSAIFFQNKGIGESPFAGFNTTTNGQESYFRPSVNIANGTYAGGTTLYFEMHAWRTLGGAGCNSSFQYVVDKSWDITVHYTMATLPKVAINSNTPLSTLDVNGKIKIGDDFTAAEAGNIRWNEVAKDLEGYDGDYWHSLTGKSALNANTIGQQSGALPVYNMVEATKNLIDSSAIIYDSGGELGNYVSNESKVWNIRVPASEIDNVLGVYVKIDSLNLPDGDDVLQVGDLFSFSNTAFGNQGMFISNFVPDGSDYKTTIVFNSDLDGVVGWGFKLTYQIVYGTKLEVDLENNPISSWKYNSSKNAIYGGIQFGNKWEEAQLGENSLQFGLNTEASGENAFALGKSKALGDGSIALGESTASASYSFAAGGSKASGLGSIAIGAKFGDLYNSSSGINSIALGRSDASGNNSMAAGQSTASGNNSTALGSSIASGDDAIAGGSSSATMIGSTAFGWGSNSTNEYATALGRSYAAGVNSTAGGQSSATKIGATAFGSFFDSTLSSTATGDYASSFGRSAASGQNSTAMGRSRATMLSATAIGNSTATNSYAFAVGISNASGVASSALGDSDATEEYSSAFGRSSASSAYTTATGYSFATEYASSAFGYSSANGNYSTAGGYSNATNYASSAFGYSSANGNYSTAGGQSTASAIGATAFGSYFDGTFNSTASGTYASSFGRSQASGNNTLATGQSTATGANATALGYSNALGDNATAGGDSDATMRGASAFGSGSISTNEYATALGRSFASGINSTAGGQSTASGLNSTAGGQSTATVIGATAFGSFFTGTYNSSAIGNYASSLGRSSASGNNALATGQSIASGINASAFGFSNASGTNSTAGGQSTASGLNSTAGGLSTATVVGASAFGSFFTSTYNSSAIGNYASSLGRSSASGINALATGQSIASGDNGSAFGFSTASGNNATAGGQSTASGNESTAFGFSTASGSRATAGGQSTASGFASTAFSNANAAGDNSIAIGENASTLGYRTIALGLGAHVAADKPGSIVISDGTENYWPSEAVSNQSWTLNSFSARFHYGYRLSTGVDVNGNYIGVKLIHGATSWASNCDVNLKENFETINGASVLDKLENIEFTSWNYKGFEPTNSRHYGIMAQDFYKAFGEDSYGTIGTDTLVNPIDLLGVAYAAIKELSLQIKALQTENELLKADAQILESKSHIVTQNQENAEAELAQRIEVLENNVELMILEIKKSEMVSQKNE